MFKPRFLSIKLPFYTHRRLGADQGPEIREGWWEMGQKAGCAEGLVQELSVSQEAGRDTRKNSVLAQLTNKITVQIWIDWL